MQPQMNAVRQAHGPEQRRRADERRCLGHESVINSVLSAESVNPGSDRVG